MKRTIRIFAIVFLMTSVMGAFGHRIARADGLTTEQKNSSYGFFLWLSEHAANDADRIDAAIAAQIVSNTLSQENRALILSTSPATDYSTVIAKTVIGGESDATGLECFRKAINYVTMGNTYRSIESLSPLKISSAMMAMSEVNANYQFTLWAHTKAFKIAENLGYTTKYSYPSKPLLTEYDPYHGNYNEKKEKYYGWYDGEIDEYNAGNYNSAGHYMNLTDRALEQTHSTTDHNGQKMKLTGFGYTWGRGTSEIDEINWNTVTQYCCQQFSDNSNYYSLVDNAGFTPTEYLNLLNQYECEVKGHDWDEPSYSWNDDNTKMTATHTCKRDGVVETEEVAATSAESKAPTCEAKGETTYTAEFTKTGFETQTKTLANIDALGHNWGEVSYSWSDDNSSVTATRTCDRDNTHKETETVSSTSNMSTAATCEAKGETTYTATFANSAFETQSKTLENIPALGHDWGEPVYTWSENNSSVTASRTCKHDAAHKETETSTVESAVTKAATCTEKGETTYTSKAFVNTAFTAQTKVLEDIDALGHEWDVVVYEWAADNSTVTASRICKRDSTHKETEKVSTKGEVTRAATCEAKGETTYTSNAYENTAFAVQTKTVDNITALGHDWGDTAYSWSDDNSTATASRTCKHDSSHVESETVNTTSKETKAATCEANGETTYTALFTKSAFSTQTKTLANIDALGHNWGEVLYSWSDDNSSVTATRTCGRENTHKETEKVNATANTSKAATCEAKGETTYTATFANSAFKTQSKTLENIPALGHDWGIVDYTWADDNSTATAKRTCSRNDKIESETVNVTSAVTTEAACETKGKTTYTATFTNSAFTTQTKTLENINALGHNWSNSYTVDVPATCTAEGSESQHCTRCNTSNLESARTTSKIDHTYSDWEITTAASCTEAGSRKKSCSACGDVVTEVIQPAGHQPNSDYTIDIEPTCTTTGSKSIHCSVCNIIIDGTSVEVPADTVAKAVLDRIAALPSTISLSNKADVEDVRSAYNQLSEKQRRLITNISVLQSAEATISRLLSDKAAADKASAEKVAAEQAAAERAAAEAAAQAAIIQEPITIAKSPASVKAKAKKAKVTISWKKLDKKKKRDKALLAQIQGIQIQVATDPGFETIVVDRRVGKKKAQIAVNLQKKTQYFVRVRYVGNGGVSIWSGTKRVKTK